MPLSVTLFQRPNLDSSQMFAQRVAHQRGTILFGLACGSVSGLQEFLIENNLDCFHMWALLHSTLHLGGNGLAGQRFVLPCP